MKCRSCDCDMLVVVNGERKGDGLVAVLWCPNCGCLRELKDREGTVTSRDRMPLAVRRRKHERE